MYCIEFACSKSSIKYKCINCVTLKFTNGSVYQIENCAEGCAMTDCMFMCCFYSIVVYL